MTPPILAESTCDDLLDELLPDRLEWRRLAGRYPKATTGLAAGLGFWLGRRRGVGLLATLAVYAAAQVAAALTAETD